jgi:gas vesicle protein
MAFVIGALVGAGTALLLTPKRGSVIRRRLRRGAAAAGGELADMAVETRDALEALGKDARRTLRRTASMIGSVFQATKEAITTDADGKGHT